MLTFDQLPQAVYNLSCDLQEIKRLLTLQASIVPSHEEEIPLTCQQAADFLNITRQTVYQNIAKIPHRKRHGRLYFFKSELTVYLRQSAQPLR